MFTSWRVKSQLALVLAVACCALVAVGLLGLVNSYKSNKELDNVYRGGLLGVEGIFRMTDTISQRLEVPLAQIGVPGEDSAELAVKLKLGQERLEKEWLHYKDTNPHLTPQNLATQRGLLEKVGAQLSQIGLIVRRVEDALRGQDQKRALTIAHSEFYPAIQPLTAVLDQIFDLHLSDSLEDYEQAERTAFWSRIALIAGIAIALALLVTLTVLITRGITKPLEYAAKRISAGDTNMDVEVLSGGELGTLLRSLREMFVSLDRISAVLGAISAGDLSIDTSVRSGNDVLGVALRNMVQRTRTMIGDIKGEVNVLATSSQEIAASLAHISTGASETASAVTETTTTVEELKQTANISVEKAKDVLSNAEETLQAVSSSEQSVATTIDDMSQIRERMQIISESIVKLSEIGKAIAEIMDTVNDIAEQSNLLAVNAAIEAAKAGEMGRSFNVVAQEIRTLAEQSKGATVQVRALLGEIQNATTAAVLATEQGSKAVAKGVEQSVQTNKTIKELGGKMSRVNQSASQIVLSNQQHLIGTEQITIAMTQIAEATNQHVEHLRQIEEAVATLNQVGATLKALADTYRIDEEGRGSVRQEFSRIPKPVVPGGVLETHRT